jgi:hypothetical protein
MAKLWSVNASRSIIAIPARGLMIVMVFCAVNPARRHFLRPLSGLFFFDANPRG